MSKQLHAFLGMSHVKEAYVPSGMSDSQFAESISDKVNTWTMPQIRQYRKVLGIANNVSTTRVSADNVTKLKDYLGQAVNTDAPDDAEWRLEVLGFLEGLK